MTLAIYFDLAVEPVDCIIQILTEQRIFSKD